MTPLLAAPWLRISLLLLAMTHLCGDREMRPILKADLKQGPDHAGEDAALRALVELRFPPLR